MTVPAEMAFVADRLDQEGKPFTAGCIRRLLAEAAEERAARLKAEAERDEMQVGGRKAIETCARVIVERGEALALLSKAREAFATTEAARQRLYAALEADRLNLAAWSVGYGPQNRAEVQAEVDTAGAAALASWADLSKILGTGETT